MERFAKRKITILPLRSGNKGVFFTEDNGTKHFCGEYSRYMSDADIALDIKLNWYKEHIKDYVK